jgi:hypothetical protein
MHMTSGLYALACLLSDLRHLTSRAQFVDKVIKTFEQAVGVLLTKLFA